jgi:hypothetical protein
MADNEPAETDSAPALRINKSVLAIVIVGGVAAILAITVAVLGFRGHKQKVDAEKLTSLVAEATVELRQALGPAPSAEGVARIDAMLSNAKAVSGNAFADATETYLLGAREIAKRRVDAERLQREAAASRQALAAHMGRAASRGTGWLQTALSLKRKVESDHSDLARTLKVLDDLLVSLGDTERSLAPFVPAASLLPDDVREGARGKAQSDAKLAADELEKVRRLTP